MKIKSISSSNSSQFHHRYCDRTTQIFSLIFIFAVLMLFISVQYHTYEKQDISRKVSRDNQMIQVPKPYPVNENKINIPDITKQIEEISNITNSLENTKVTKLPIEKRKEKKNEKHFSSINKPFNRKQYEKIYNFESDWGYNGMLKYIEVLPDPSKIPLKKNRRVVFKNLKIEQLERPHLPPSNIPGYPRSYTDTLLLLKQHYFQRSVNASDGHTSLEDTMYILSRQPECKGIPIFLSMATLGDELYWQLVENFVYTLARFNLHRCAIVICVSDSKCIEKCQSEKFPCFNYQDSVVPLPSPMEQIAKMKLFHIPKALSWGVDVFLLDLDVGFLADPNYFIKVFQETPVVDILVQEDLQSIMNRTKAGWKTWFYEPIPNIGLFLCRGNNKTAKMFSIAWDLYSRITDPYEKSLPAKDQNTVLEAMRMGRGNFGLKFAYFPNNTTPLMDKLVLFHGHTLELGGEIMSNFLSSQQSVAIHTTCYEHSTKVMGLKAANAFWHPRYYDPLRRTITKQIIFINEEQLIKELRSLIWLAINTNRSLIIPNILGPDHIDKAGLFQGKILWPGFRVAFISRMKNQKLKYSIDILEPSFYWRIQRDYDEIPEPFLVTFDPHKDTIFDLKNRLSNANDYSRIILYGASNIEFPFAESPQIKDENLVLWANHSVGVFQSSFRDISEKYFELPLLNMNPTIDDPSIEYVFQTSRTCYNVFKPNHGNRTCFSICK